MPAPAPAPAPAAARDPRTLPIDADRHVRLAPERVSAVSSTDYPGHHAAPAADHTWDHAAWRAGLRVDVRRLSGRSVEVDVVGVDASVANALRRVMIAEVPTIAIENVYVWNNTSVIQDEVLAHRLGLVPLNIDPRLFDMRDPLNDTATDRNTLVFRLEVACERVPQPRRAQAPAPAPAHPALPLPPATSPYTNEHVYARHLTWVPQGEQPAVFAAAPDPRDPDAHLRDSGAGEGKGSRNGPHPNPNPHPPPGPTNPDIVLAKLRPGQEVVMDLHAIKGVGREHAKWSPVATASYRTLPLITLNPDKPVPPERAYAFQACFSPGVIHVDPATHAVSTDTERMRKDTVSREVLRHPEFEGCVTLGRVRDWFIFNVESEGPYAPQSILPEAVKVMRAKIALVRRAAEALAGIEHGSESEGGEEGRRGGGGGVGVNVSVVAEGEGEGEEEDGEGDVEMADA